MTEKKTTRQIEAMTLADRIVLMRDGLIEQQGAPLDLFEQPATIFVAGFLGSPKMNFLRGRIERGSDGVAVRLGEEGALALRLPPARNGAAARDGMPVILGLRPEHIGRAPEREAGPGAARLDAVIDLVQPTGSRIYATFALAGQPVMAELHAHDVSRPGERLAIEIDLRRATIFDPESGKAL